MSRAPLHPFLFAVFPVVFLYGRNVQHVRAAAVVGPLAAAVAGTAVVLALAWLVMRDLRRAAVATSVVVVLFMSYGHVWDLLGGRSIGGLVWGRDLFLAPLAVVLALVGVVLAARMRRSSGDVTKILDVLGASLLAVALVGAGIAIARLETGDGGPSRGTRAEAAQPPPAPLAPASASFDRDIYFIVFDRYGGEDVLDRYFDVDTSPFLDELRSRGFYVADDSRSNYNKTAHSVAAAMNMTYLDDLARRYGDSSDWSRVYKMLPNPRVVRMLREQGYGYAHIGSWWEPTSHDSSADVNYHFSEARRSEFSRLLMQTTALEAIGKHVGGPLRELDWRRVQHEQILYQFDAIPQAGARPGPTFVFAHILLPHEPFTFDAQGRFVSEEQEASRSFVRNYREQVVFADRKILELVDRLFDVPESRRPIVVLNADEGPHPLVVKLPPGATGWTNAGAEALRVKFPIFNAIHLPGAGARRLYPSITPVNTFRVIFDAYFGTRLGLLPDRNFVYAADDRPYDLRDVTAIIEGSS